MENIEKDNLLEALIEIQEWEEAVMRPSGRTFSKWVLLTAIYKVLMEINEKLDETNKNFPLL
ncbi:unnamed protein product [marine sediment metagenome]|uniref:Uncharacterized protein n=1 Tax=marine sediment metagenome TaxID=412755 RepID=X1PJA1_9ZZZZ